MSDPVYMGNDFYARISENVPARDFRVAVDPSWTDTYVYVADTTQNKQTIYKEVEQAVKAGRFAGKERSWGSNQRGEGILVVPKPDKKAMKEWWNPDGYYPSNMTTAGIVASDEIRQEFVEALLAYGLKENLELSQPHLRFDKSFPVSDHICEQIQAFVQKYPHTNITLEADSKEGSVNAKLAEFLRGLDKSASYTGTAEVAGEKIASPFARDFRALKKNRGLKTEEERKAEYIQKMSDNEKKNWKLGLVKLPSFKKTNSFQQVNANVRDSASHYYGPDFNTWDISTYGELSDEQLKAMEAFHKEHPEITIWGTEDQQKQFPDVEDKGAAAKRIQLVASGKSNELNFTDLTRIPEEIGDDLRDITDKLREARKGKSFDLVLTPEQQSVLRIAANTPRANNWKRQYGKTVKAGLKGKGAVPSLRRTLARLLSSNSRKGKGSR